MPRFEPVDHDPFAPRPMALMPVDNDPFMVSPEDAFAYGQGISPDATWRNLIPAAELGLSLAPGSGEAMSAWDAWKASGRGAEALSEGNYGDAASEYLNMGTGLLGAIPGAGIVARGTKRGAAWMDRNLPTGFNRLLDSVYPDDPRSTTNIFAGPTAKTADHALPWETQDVPDDQQIVRFGGSGPQSSTGPSGSKTGGVRLERVIDDELPEGQAFFNILEEGRPSQGHVSGGLDPNDPTKFIIYSITAPSSSNSLGPAATRDLLRQLTEHFPDVTQIGGTRLTGARQRAGMDVTPSQMTVPIRRER